MTIHISNLANKFIKLTLEAQQLTSAQSSDIEHILSAAGLWNLSDQVSQMLNFAKVPDTSSVLIGLSVDKAYNINYPVVLTPPHASAKTLSSMLKAKFSQPMKSALLKAKVPITETLTLKWLKF